MDLSTKLPVDIPQLSIPGHKLRIAGTAGESIVDGEGYRYTIFTQGCPHHCFGCQNPQTHDFQGGRLVEPAKLLREILDNPLLEGVTFSGGEPFCQSGLLAELAVELHQSGLTIWCYTGYSFEDLLQSRQQAVRHLLQQVDVLVDGPYIEAQRDISLQFRGSRNQRLIDVAKSLAKGRVFLHPEL